MLENSGYPSSLLSSYPGSRIHTRSRATRVRGGEPGSQARFTNGNLHLENTSYHLFSVPNHVYILEQTSAGHNHNGQTWLPAVPTLPFRRPHPPPTIIIIRRPPLLQRHHSQNLLPPLPQDPPRWPTPFGPLHALPDPPPLPPPRVLYPPTPRPPGPNTRPLSQEELRSDERTPKQSLPNPLRPALSRPAPPLRPRRRRH